ncbi:hypothetical protein G6O69_38635, partial [Pseudenhygromyxa sp. WMMC2535]|nr:hypothetical protein [Pseudenhygromyxa sp. WMMC2535]
SVTHRAFQTASLSLSISCAFSSGCGDPSAGDVDDEIGSESTEDTLGTEETGSSSDSDSTETDSDSDSDSDSSDSDSTDSDSSETGDENLDCSIEGAFQYAPPATEIDGLFATPIDILATEATIFFSLGSQHAIAEVSVDFRVGPEGGMPIFDLRQTIDAGTFDQQFIDPAAAQRHDFGKGLDYGFRILEFELEPCTEHTLTLQYALDVPDAPEAGGLEWSTAPNRLYFDSWLSDLNPGRYLESWLPANLPFDRQALTLYLVLEDAGVPHTLLSNAEIEEFSEHDWKLEFPDTTTAMAPLIIVVPSEQISASTGVHQAANAQDIPYTLVRHETAGESLTSLEARLLDAIDEFVTSTGDFLHPAMLGYVSASARSMEYDGGFTTKPSDLEHEAFHSWWARGVHPATYADGWIDEAWDMYNTTLGLSFTVEPFDWDDAPTELYDAHPFARDTPNASYWTGRAVFAGRRTRPARSSRRRWACRGRRGGRRRARSARRPSRRARR